MTRARSPRPRHAPLVLAVASLLLAALLGASSAQAVYGGLGHVDEGLIVPGTEGKPGQVNPGGKSHSHAFAVDPKTADLFIADELTVTENSKKKNYARIQEFSSGPAGEFLAETRVELQRPVEGASPERVGGLAVDSERGKVYLLLDEERTSETEIEEEIEAKEEKLAHAKSKEEEEKLEKEIAELKAELPLFDAEQPAASELYSFTIAASNKELPKHKVLSSKVLLPKSEAGKVPLLDPTGIAVDPKTHDIVIMGQQDESTNRDLMEGESAWHAAVQRVHENGTLGPRYVDTPNCLDFGQEPADEEPLCLEDESSFPSSPIVSSGGKVFVEDGQEVWQVPAISGAGEEFSNAEVVKDDGVKPKHLYSLESSAFFKELAHEQEGGAMSFVPVTSHRTGWLEGRLYLDARVEEGGGGNGLVEVNYAEPEVEEEGKAEPEAREVGWTAGQGVQSTEKECVLISGVSTPILVAAGDEDVFAFTTSSPSVVEYGPGGEACGHTPTVSRPTVEVGNNPNASEVGAGVMARLSSRMSEAQALEVAWTFKHKNPENGQVETEKVEPGYQVESTPSLQHAFSKPGEYEITETVTTDSLAHPTVTSETTKLTVTGIKAIVAVEPESPAAQEEATVSAEVEDRAEAPVQLKAVWKFSDGTVVEKTYEGPISPVKLEIKHAFATPGAYEVTLEVTDKSGLRHTSATVPVTVVESAAEKAQKQKKIEEEKAQKEQQEKQEQEALKHKQEEEARAQKQKEEEAAALKKHQEEEALLNKKHEEEAHNKSGHPTRGQLLAKALAVCRKESKGKKLSKCEAAAHKKYGSKPRSKKKHGKKK